MNFTLDIWHGTCYNTHTNNKGKDYMTVKELIDKLRAMPNQDADVCFDSTPGASGTFHDIVNVEPGSITLVILD